MGRKILPSLLIVMGVLACAGATFGTRAQWMHYPHGLDVILWSRQLLWPLATLAGLCVAGLIGLVLAGKTKTWWLIGLLPVFAMLVIRAVQPSELVRMTENPPLVSSAAANFLRDDDPVLGVSYADETWAIPIGALQISRVVLLQDRQRRVLVMFSPAANRATAWSLDRELKLRDLEYVCTPAGATLVYDRRLGQFINAITGLTPKGSKPIGFRSLLDTTKCTWAGWRIAHPKTSVVQLGLTPIPAPTTRPVAIVATTQPIAVPSDSIADLPVNLSTPAGPLLLLRDKASGQIRAFDRHLEDDLTGRFVANIDPKRPLAALVDVDSNTGWSKAGIAVDGPPEHQGKKLLSYSVDDGLDLEVMKQWYPNLALVEVKDENLGRPLPPAFPKPQPRRTRKR